MSNKVMNWAWEHSSASGNTLLVLIKIADNSNDQGTDAWPSFSTLMRLCKISRQTVQNCIDRLCEEGVLEVERKFGSVNHYSFPKYIEQLREKNDPLVKELDRYKRKETGLSKSETGLIQEPTGLIALDSNPYSEPLLEPPLPTEGKKLKKRDTSEYTLTQEAISEIPEKLLRQPDFLEWWKRWVEYRKSKGKKQTLSKYGAKLQLEDFCDPGNVLSQNPIAAMRNSIKEGYQGLVMPKNLQQAQYNRDGPYSSPSPTMPASKPFKSEPVQGAVSYSEASKGNQP